MISAGANTALTVGWYLMLFGFILLVVGVCIADWRAR